MRHPAALACLAVALVTTLAAAQTEWLDRVDRALSVGSPDGRYRADLSGLFDLEGYYIDQRPPGLVFGGDQSFANPRLTLFLDASVGRHLYAFVQTRFDRGFDAREGAPHVRLDEYLARWIPLGDPRLNLQFGKFATVVGSWVARHHSWENPLINAPLPYENVTTISDGSIPPSEEGFLDRRRLADRKRLWVPIVWGPNYASGGAAFGRVGMVEYAGEVKNAALSDRPAEWDLTDRGLGAPTASGRLGIRPHPAWAAGVSLSSGPYLRDQVDPMLPPGGDVSDFRQKVVAGDLSFARRHLELWAEVYASRWEVPIPCGACRRPAVTTEDADTLAYYLEGRYKLTPRLWGALRWNQQWFGDVADGVQEQPWDHDVWRVDAALGYRLDRHLQAKLQYSFTHQTGPIQQGEQLVAAQVTVKF